MKISNSLAVLGLVGALGCALPASAAEHVVTAKATAWEPMVIFIQPGDSVRFVNMAGHNTASIDDMIPAGAATWESTLGEDASVTFEQPGAYIYKCVPHVSQGMVGAIIVGDGTPGNLDALEASPENKSTVARTVRKMKAELQAKGMM